MYLKNDSRRHLLDVRGKTIEYRLSKQKCLFWIRDVATNKSIQYISHENGTKTPFFEWYDFLNEYFVDIIDEINE